MKKGLGLICFMIGLCVVFGACSKSDTYADKLNEERKNISRFINEHDIVVLSSYPSSGVFKPNEYFKDPLTGVYINVIDSGNGNRASVAKRSLVNVRFFGAMKLPASESDTISNYIPGLQPFSLTYGITATYNAANPGSLEYFYLSPGVAAPLQFVGENAIVSLIVPFSSGSTYQKAAYKAMYYTKLQYTRIVN